MSHLRVIVCRVEDETSDKMSEIASFDLPNTEINTLCPINTIDELEQTTFEIGQPILKKIMQAQWEEMDNNLANKTRKDFFPSECQKRRK